MQIDLLTKKYGERTVLQIENICFEKGKKYALIGENGAGKSTFLKILANLLSATEKKGDFGVKDIRYMPQESFAFDFSLFNNVLIGCPFSKRREYKEEALRLIDALKLTSLIKKRASRFSGGEKQRMALARTLIVKSELFLLDEPTAATDIEKIPFAEAVIQERTEGAITVFSTHSIKQAERLADVIIFLKEGKIIEYGSNILTLPNSEELKNYLANQ